MIRAARRYTAHVPQHNRIGERLRSAREKLGISVETAAADAGIPVQYVRLLEGESNVRVGVADELYLIPFFRRYAAFVGLDAAELLPEFLSRVQQTPGEGSPPVQLTYRSTLTALWKPAAVIGAVALAAMLLLRQGASAPPFDERGAATSPPTPEPQVVAIAPAPAASAHDAGGPSHAAISAPGPAAPRGGRTGAAAGAALAAASPTPAPGSPTDVRELRIVANEETWLSIDVDGAGSRSVILQPGETRTWTASDGFTLTVGNAGGITLVLDGRELPTLGKSGQVVRNVRLPSTSDPSGG